MLRGGKEKKNILRRVNRRKGNWIGHNLRRNCRLKHFIDREAEGRTEVTGSRGRKF